MARPITKAEASAEIIRRVRNRDRKREAKANNVSYVGLPPSRPDLRRLTHAELLDIAS